MAGAGVTWCWRAKEAGALALRPARLIVALSASVIVALTGLTTLQIRVWRDAESLWRHAVAVDPGGAFNHYHLAGALSLLGKREEARAEFAKAIDLVPEGFDAKGLFYSSLGRELLTSGDLEGAEQNYTAALRYSPDEETALNNLGVIYALRGDDQASLDMFLRLLRVAPGNDAACRNVSLPAARLGVKLGGQTNCPSESAHTSERALPLRPSPSVPRR